VKTVIPCPKEKVAELLVDIYNLRLTLPVRGGDMVIPNWQGTGIDVIAVRSVG
jgi:CxxC motif-containing protein